MQFFETTTNSECMDGSEIMNGIPLTFGYEFIPKGNFTFTFIGAIKDSLAPVLCSPFLFFAKEMVRRTKYSAIAKFAESDKFSIINGSPAGPFISMLFRNECSLFLTNNFGVTPNVLPFIKLTPFSRIAPLISIIGTIYPLNDTDSIDSAINIFDFYVWFCILLGTLLVSFVNSFRVRTESNECIFSNYLGNIWIAFNSAYFGMRIKVNRITHFITYSLNVWMAFIILRAFSSAILSTIISTPFTSIDSLSDLRARPDLTHFVHYSFESIQLIRKLGTKEEIELLERGLINTRPELVTNEVNLIYGDAKKEIKRLIIKEKTHVFVSNLGHSKMIETSVIGQKSSHISREHYLYILESCVHNKYLDPFIEQKFNNLIYDLIETKHYDRWVTAIMEAVAKFFKVEDQDTSDQTDYHDQFVVKLMPALGPFIFGITISFLIFLLEICKYTQTYD